MEHTTMISLRKVNFKRDQREILSDINLHINPGENWVILGRNGSGKTTILELVTGYQFPSSGQVEVFGNVYGQVDIREVRKSIGYISQTLFEKLHPGDPVWEVVATGEYAYLRFYEQLPDEVRDKAIEMLKRVRLAHLKDQPLGTLSQGERRKIMLARSLMSTPKILIMDEPCAGLDLYEREQMLQAIQDLCNQDISLLYITHHIEEIVPLFTHIAIIEQGRIVAAGPKAEVLTAKHISQAFDVNVQIGWTSDRPWIQVL
jgi:iron complex transport system ATP-binding protein